VAGQLFVCAKTTAPTVVIDETVNTELPVLDRVTTCGELVVRIRWVVKVSDVGEKEAIAAVPTPLSGTGLAMPAGEPLVTRLPDSEPSLAGLKTTLMLQVAPAASVPGQLFVSLKSGLSVRIWESWKAPVPVLVRVIDCGLLLVPTCWAANVN